MNLVLIIYFLDGLVGYDDEYQKEEECVSQSQAALVGLASLYVKSLLNNIIFSLT